uniref:IS66 family insertion sequence element accessory protein TnpB n=1 Tax=uncultured Sphingorhabdus sp. TaxID=1686106 RepID=UPI00260579A6
MIIPAQGLRIVLAVRPVDFRCGHDALAGLVQNTLGLDPHSGLIVVFRSKRADRLKELAILEAGCPVNSTVMGAQVHAPLRMTDEIIDMFLKLPEL